MKSLQPLFATLRTLGLGLGLLLPVSAWADLAVLVDQAVLVQTNPSADTGQGGTTNPSEGQGTEESPGPVAASYVSSGGWAVTGAEFKDVATVVFDFNNVTSVTAATLKLPIADVFPQNGSAEVQITFYSDDDGFIEFDDLSVGFVEPLAEIESIALDQLTLDVTGPVNAALQSGRFVGFRVSSTVEASAVDPELFPSFTGIQLASNPYLEFVPGAAPVPDSTKTTFDGYTLNVPSIEAGGVGEVAATLKLVDPNELIFELTAAQLVSSGSSAPPLSGLDLLNCSAFSRPESTGVAAGIANYSVSSGIMDIPSVNLYGKQVAVRLEYIEGSNPWLFETLSLASVQSGPSQATISALGGGILVEPTQEFIPLCHGWVLVGDYLRNRVVERNLITGETGKVYPFNTAPGQMILDEANGRVHMTVHPESERLYTLDLATGTVNKYPLSQTLGGGGGFVYTYGFAPRYLTLGEDGNIFAILFDGENIDPENDIPYSDTQLWLGLMDPNGNFLIDSRPLEEPVRLEYHAPTDVLFGTTQSNLATFVFNPVTNAINIVPGTDVPVGSNCTDFDISPDGKRLAYTCPQGNYAEQEEFSIVDMDPFNYYNNDGEWYFGTSPISATFNQSGTLLFGVDSEKLYVFDVVTHLILEDYELGLVEGETIKKVRLSKDGGLIYLFLENENHAENSKFYWMPTPNIVGTPL